MAVIQHQIKKYSVVCYSKVGDERVQRILLYGADGNIKAWLYFYRGGAALPAPSGSNAPRDIKLHYRSSRLGTIVDLLRNEDPIYVYYDTDRTVGAVYTGAEEIGEEET